MSTPTTTPASHLVLVANADDGTITTLRLVTDGDAGSDSGRLDEVTSTRVGDGCGTLAYDADRHLVYAATKAPEIVTLRLDPDAGTLTEVARRSSEDALAYVAVTADGSTVLGAAYDAGCARTWPVRDGVLGDPVAHVEHANCHCVVPVGDRAYVVSLGEDVVCQYALGADATLTPLDPPTVALPDGCGPRHLDVEGDVAYLVTEYSAEVFRFDVGADGTLTRAESVRVDDPSADLAHSRMGADPAKEHLRWGADVHRTGRWILASERTASTLASVALDGSGHLGEVAAIVPTPTQPRAFGIAPDGRHVVAVGEKSTQARLYRLGDDGSLAQLGEAAVGAGARWVTFA